MLQNPTKMLSTFISTLLLSSAALAQVTYQNHSQTILRVDTGQYGPELEEYHYYYDQWPIGLAISSKGRFFVSYTRGNYSYTLGEAINKTAEIPYPILISQPPCLATEYLVERHPVWLRKQHGTH
jgi:hypothetical protein